MPRQVNCDSLAEALHRSTRWAATNGAMEHGTPESKWREWNEIDAKTQDGYRSMAEYMLSKFNIYGR